MWNIVKIVIAFLVLVVFVTLALNYFVKTYSSQADWLSWVLIVLAIIGLIISIATNITKHSRRKLGNVTRYEFYMALIALAGWLFQVNNSLNGRIDTLFNIIAKP